MKSFLKNAFPPTIVYAIKKSHKIMPKKDFKEPTLVYKVSKVIKIH